MGYGGHNERAPAYRRPESVLVLVHTEAGEVLVLRRRHPAGFWQSVTGSLEWDETPAQAAARELAEETGICAQPRDCDRRRRFPIYRAWRARFAPGTAWNTEHWFALSLPARCPVRLSEEEHDLALWLPADQAGLLVTSWTNREAIEQCLPAPGAAAPTSGVWNDQQDGSPYGRSQ